jgi:hypothetical protein
MASRTTRWVPALAALAALITGCGGLSTVEAEQRCDQERAADSTCIREEAYDQCVTCYEECGDDCARGKPCPAQYSCPE